MILITGANGFLGRRLCASLVRKELPVCAAVRGGDFGLDRDCPRELRRVIVGDIGPSTEWLPALKGVGTVIHCAARAHQTSDSGKQAYELYHEVNVEGSVRLAESAVEAGVRRLVFVSSIKVNGEKTREGSRFQASDLPAPEDAYGISKCKAEAALREIAQRSDLELVIVRPPLVHGPYVKGNLYTLMKLIHARVPLPLGLLDNRRSLVGIDNLVSFLIYCGLAPNVAERTFLVSDGEDLTLRDILVAIAIGLDRKPFLLPVPRSVLSVAFRMIRRSDLVDKLCSSLRVDISETLEHTEWRPRQSTKDGLIDMAHAFRRAYA